ncbi:hypothetical protein ACTMTJ_17345 [Phytohabitans sp. LJ34]|uniref:hypothetical protein n=1 Tax=Phytohabitans sp. LJ34 TaxID=3452217 RepID=UPI003F8919ED
MTDLVLTLGRRITERWAAVVVLPGLLYAAVAAWAVACGHRHALDATYALARARSATGGWGDAASVVVLAAGLLAAATVAGAVATTVGERVVHRYWIRDASPARQRRLRERTEETWAARDDQPPTRYLPVRATAVGERFRLLGERLDAEYGLSAPLAWPRLWLIVDAEVRKLVDTAHRQYFTDATWAAWGLLYLPWAVWWWPAALLGLAAIAIGTWRAPTSATTLATLMESTVDTHQAALAAALGVALPEDRITPEIGNQINDALNKRA